MILSAIQINMADGVTIFVVGCERSVASRTNHLLTAAFNWRYTVMSEAEIENEIQSKGLNAPRLTPTLIDEVIASEQYHVFDGTTLTVCCLTLNNGFTVTGESAAASPENFDEEIGRKIARQNAREKIWPLEGYLLRQNLHEAQVSWDAQGAEPR